MNPPLSAINVSFQPERRWSLLAVLKLYATSFIAMGEHLGSADLLLGLADAPSLTPDDIQGIVARAEAQLDNPESLPQRIVADPQAVGALRAVIPLAQKMEMNVSARLIEQALVDGKPTTYGEYTLLKQALYMELEGKALFYIPSERVKYFDSATILSDKAKQAFETAYVELREAGSCYALGRFTGAVLHAMRAAENGVKALSRVLGHNPPDLTQQDWHPILEKCESLIDEIRDKKRKGPEKEETLKVYSQAAAQFRHFKDGWRVQAAHARPPFNESEARTILDATISFFEVLSPHLSEVAPEPTV